MSFNLSGLQYSQFQQQQQGYSQTVYPYQRSKELTELLNWIPEMQPLIMDPSISFDLIDAYHLMARGELNAEDFYNCVVKALEIFYKTGETKHIVFFLPSQNKHKITEEAEQILFAGTGEAADTPETPCPKCRKTKTIFSAEQTRSADEGMTYFLICAFCRHKWLAK